MTDDCYWNHRTPKKNCYLCMDGESMVCPRCCVECCPTETPDWFARCAAAGHPPWPGSVPSLFVPFLYDLHTWNKLAETFESVQRDFKPARKMGYILVEAP